MPKKLKNTIIGFIAALIILPSVMIAQVNATGSIAGYVTDDGKEPLPGATVTVTSPTMLGVRQVMADPTGYYKIPALPPGKFKVVVELDQFNKTTRDRVELNVGAMMRLDFALNPKTVTEEEIVVTADAPVIEPEKTTISTVITHDILDSLPILGRDFMSSLRILPGVIQAGDFMSISGGRDTEKNYNIDGMDNVDVAQGKALAGGGYSLKTDKSLMNFDQEAIQELSVATGGYGADTGWGSAGVINVVTKSGSNAYRGSLYLDFRNNKLDVDNPVAYQSYYFGGSLSGPIVKDKLLFFLSVTPRYNKDAYDRRSWWMKDVPETYRMKGSNLGAFLKLTWLLSEKHTLTLSTNPYHNYSMRHLTLFRYPGDYPEENNYYDNMSVNANLTSIFSKKFLLESKGLFVFNDNRRRNPPGTHAGTVYDYTAGLHFSGTYGDHDWTKVKANWTETANIFIDDWMGRHTITVGAEVRYNKQADQRVAQESITLSPTYTIRDVQPAVKWSTSQTYYAAYLSDKWSPVKNLVLQPGVRVSNNSFMSEFLIEPRFNLSWDPFMDGKTVIRAGANLYRDRVGDYIQQMTNYPLTTVYYKFPWMEFVDSRTYRVYVTSPDITYPKTTEFTIGLDRDLFWNIFATANFIYRDYRDQIYTRYVNLMDPVTMVRDDPTKGRLSQLNNGGYAKYKGFQFVLGKHLGGDWFQFLLSFTHQVSKGNSFLFLDMSQHQGVLNPEFKGDAQPADLYGLTAYDKPYAFKAYVAARLPWQFLVSAIFDVTAGTPYTTFSYDPPTYEHPHFVSGYQALRSPQTKNLDLRLEKDFRIKGKYNIKFKLDVFNVFNWESVYEVLAEVDNPDFGMPYNLGPTRRIQLGFRFDF